LPNNGRSCFFAFDHFQGGSMQSNNLRIGFLIVAIGIFAAATNARTADNPILHRNGAAEARSDAAQGRPIRIYSNVANGFIPGFASPGLANCAPLKVSSNIFVLVPEAAFQEGSTASTPYAVYSAAVNFMASYNREVLKIRGDELRRHCPNVSERP
jgi:hypothetical protein